MTGLVYHFEEYELDVDAWELRRCERAVDLPSVALSVLLVLLDHRERVVSRAELFDRIWHGVMVNDGSLTQAIWQIRQALNDDPREPRLVRTVRGRGYRFVGPVRRLERPAVVAMAPSAREKLCGSGNEAEVRLR